MAMSTRINGNLIQLENSSTGFLSEFPATTIFFYDLKCTLRASKHETFSTSLEPWSALTGGAFTTCVTTHPRSKKLSETATGTIFMTVTPKVYFPEKDSVVIIGNGYIHVTNAGMSTCPVSKTTRAIASAESYVRLTPIQPKVH